MKNFNTSNSYGSPWLKAPRTGATRTLTRIARIHSHTLHQHSYNHLVRSASSAVLFSVHAGSFRFSVMHRTLDIDYRIFNVRTWSFLCVRIYIHTGVGHTADSESAQYFWLGNWNSPIFLVLLTGFDPSSFGAWVRRSTNWATPSPIINSKADIEA